MKKIISSLFVLSALLVGCGPTVDDAVLFNDLLVKAHTGCVDSEKSFFDACEGLNPEEIKSSFERFKQQVDASMMIVKNIKNEKEFAAFKASGEALVTSYKTLVGKEYDEYAMLYTLPEEQYDEAASARCAEVADKINATLDPLTASFLEAQKQFAREWNFLLTKD